VGTRRRRRRRLRGIDLLATRLDFRLKLGQWPRLSCRSSVCGRTSRRVGVQRHRQQKRRRRRKCSGTRAVCRGGHGFCSPGRASFHSSNPFRSRPDLALQGEEGLSRRMPGKEAAIDCCSPSTEFFRALSCVVREPCAARDFHIDTSTQRAVHGEHEKSDGGQGLSRSYSFRPDLVGLKWPVPSGGVGR